jgi:Stringent starvation protein B
MPRRSTAKMTASACLIAATAALASPASADPISCDSAEARDIMINTLPRAGDDRPLHVTFRTRAEGVKLPAYLLTQYPEEMTVILQYQFERLVVKDDRITVDLSFKRRPERLVIPFAAVTGFYDQSVVKCRSG